VGKTGELGELLAAQAGGAPARRPGVAGVSRVEAVAPAAHQGTEAQVAHSSMMAPGVSCTTVTIRASAARM
jgi:hypothetical protein